MSSSFLDKLVNRYRVRKDSGELDTSRVIKMSETPKMAEDDINAYINSILPKEYSVPAKGIITKKMIEDILVDLAKKDGAKFGEVVQAIKKVGDELATRSGASIGLVDLKAPAERDRIIRELQVKMSKPGMDPLGLAAIVAEADKKLQALSLKMENTMADLVKSGARGNARQLSQTVASPVAGSIKGNILPVAVTHSFAEGLPFPEFFVVADPGREATFQTRTAISEPGAATKMLVTNMNDLVITMQDCGSTEGDWYDVESGDILGRYTAEMAGTVRRNTLIDSNVVSQLKSARIKKIKVRSVKYCKAVEGICAKCYGLDEYGQLPEIGVNLGIRSAQAMSEPLSQFALNAKHGSRSIEAGTSKSGMKYINQLFKVPKNFPNAAVLSEISGVVRSINKTDLGDYIVELEPLLNNKMGREKYIVPTGQKVIVKIGEAVDEGDALSDGVINPVSVVQAKGPAIGRKVLSDIVNEAYRNTGQQLDSRHFDMYSKGVVRYVKILKSDDNEFIPGDTVTLDEVYSYLKENNETVDPMDAIGRYIAEAVGPYLIGTRITPFLAVSIKKSGVDKVKVNKKNFDFEPTLFSAEMSPRKSGDWLYQLQSRNLVDSVKDAAMFGLNAKIKDSVRPTGPFAYGEFFNRSTEPGRY